VIIVDTRYIPSEQHYYHWVASHDPDTDNYPYEQFYDFNPSMVYRFIKIKRLDGDREFLSSVFGSNNGMALQIKSPLINPYPAQMENNTPFVLSPYPAP